MMQIRGKRTNRSNGLRADRGAAEVEFVLSILTVLFVMFWTWEVVMAVYTYSVIADAAREGVRYAIVHGSKNSNCSGPVPAGFTACPDPSGANVTAVVRDYASYSFHDISAIVINVTYDTYNASPGRVQVAVTYNFIPYTAFPFHPRLKATAVGRIAN
ncbi:MAG: hypothetical protein DMG25_16935 [Acidobacteria bacterium]|nr:MAG: hypothetical protein DMG25_16935 [Acidobacteriota bacterium]